jgi:hypothetical protein
MATASPKSVEPEPQLEAPAALVKIAVGVAELAQDPCDATWNT